MNKKTLAKRMSEQTGFSLEDCLDFVNGVIMLMQERLRVEGAKVRLNRIGTFVVQRDAKRVVQDWKNNQRFYKYDCKRLAFKPSKLLDAFLNNSNALIDD